MDSATIQSIITLVTALLPQIEAGAIVLYNDVKQLLTAATASTDATPDQLAAVQTLDTASDKAYDAAFAAYEAAKPAAATPSTFVKGIIRN